MTISWLQLERYALGELTGAERADVERRLEQSSEDRACLDAILEDSVELPPLPAVIRRKRTPWWIGGVALAAAIALALVPRDVPSRRTASDGVKGGEAAVMLISERTGNAPRNFRDGDRFKLLVTCPPWLSSRLSVVLFQDGQRYQPLAAHDLACGNQVPWPGAFALDGAHDVEVCVTWREHRDARSGRDLEPDAVCERIAHE